MPFFEYSQNNSYGHFDYQDSGISALVVIEADSAKAANSTAEELGLYFDGAGDCPCCGNRWSDKWGDDEGDEEPSYYGTPIRLIERWQWPWMGAKPEMFIHYKNGDIDAVFVKDEVPEIKPWKRTEEQKAVEPKKTRTRKTAKELESA